MKWLLLLLLVSRTAYADPDWDMYHKEDHFTWSNYDDDVHLLGAYAVSLTGGLILEHQFGMKRWQAALTMGIVTGIAGTFKEVFMDTYCSKTDLITMWTGGIVGGISLIVVEF